MLNSFDKKRITKTIIAVGIPFTVTLTSYAIFKKPLILEVGAVVLGGGSLSLMLDDFVHEMDKYNKALNENAIYKEELFNNYSEEEEYHNKTR